MTEEDELIYYRIERINIKVFYNIHADDFANLL